MIYRLATLNETPAITDLINRSYRGDSSRAGWTTEADLLYGKRIDEAGIMALFKDPDSQIFIAQNEEKTIIGTLHAHHQSETIHFSLFAIEPTQQSNGIGKQLLVFAETESHRIWGSDTAIMEVISLRNELINYYERRGYKRTGEINPFPLSTLWTPYTDELELIVLEKKLFPLPRQPPCHYAKIVL